MGRSSLRKLLSGLCVKLFRRIRGAQKIKRKELTGLYKNSEMSDVYHIMFLWLFLSLKPYKKIQS
jgi:hypothetical protein